MGQCLPKEIKQVRDEMEFVFEGALAEFALVLAKLFVERDQVRVLQKHVLQVDLLNGEQQRSADELKLPFGDEVDLQSPEVIYKENEHLGLIFEVGKAPYSSTQDVIDEDVVDVLSIFIVVP